MDDMWNPFVSHDSRVQSPRSDFGYFVSEITEDEIKSVDFAHYARTRGVTDLFYTVVEELVDDAATVVVSMWPRVDGERRVFNDDPGSDRVFTVSFDPLQRTVNQLRKSRSGPPDFLDGNDTRRLRVGDAFAINGELVRILDLMSSDSFGENRKWVGDSGPFLIDITEESRSAAEVAANTMLVQNPGTQIPEDERNSGDITSPSENRPLEGAVIVELNGDIVARIPVSDFASDQVKLWVTLLDGSESRVLWSGGLSDG